MDSAIVKRDYRFETIVAQESPLESSRLVVPDHERRLANHRIAFLGHAVLAGTVVLFLLVVAGFDAAVIVGLAWAVPLGAHGFFGVAAPMLRRKWTEERALATVDRRVLSDERRVTESRHTRSLEELSASIAHEIRNPITAAKSLVQQIAADPTSTDNPEYARVALEELERVERSVSHLLRYARDEELSKEEVDLFDVVSAALDLLGDRIASQNARIERDLDAGSFVRGDREKLRRVVTNLVENALDALETSSDADPFVRISCGKSLSGKEVWLRVKDNGPGMNAALLAKMWSPFFTTKKKGTGLGLAITKKLVEAHGGSVEGVSEPRMGAEIIVTLPSGEPVSR